MATPLTKPVRRELRSADRKGRLLIATLEPGDMLSFRPKGSKRSVSVYLGQAFILAQILQINSDYKDKLKQYDEDRSLGKRRRRPVKPILPFGKVYLDSLK
jgi:hypothetical protein